MSVSLKGVNLFMDENKNTQGLYQALWNSADILRSKMDASEYKNYLLGLVFISIYPIKCYIMRLIF